VPALFIYLMVAVSAGGIGTATRGRNFLGARLLQSVSAATAEAAETEKEQIETAEMQSTQEEEVTKISSYPEITSIFDQTTDTARFNISFPVSSQEHGFTLEPYSGSINGGENTVIDQITYGGLKLGGHDYSKASIISVEIKASYINAETKDVSGDKNKHGMDLFSGALFGAKRWDYKDVYGSLGLSLRLRGSFDDMKEVFETPFSVGGRFGYRPHTLPIDIGVSIIQGFESEKKPVNSENLNHVYAPDTMAGVDLTYSLDINNAIKLTVDHIMRPSADKTMLSLSLDMKKYGVFEINPSLQDSNYALWPDAKEIAFGYQSPEFSFGAYRGSGYGNLGYVERNWDNYSEIECKVIFGLTFRLGKKSPDLSVPPTVKAEYRSGQSPRITKSYNLAPYRRHFNQQYMQQLSNGNFGPYQDWINSLNEMSMNDRFSAIRSYGWALDEQFGGSADGDSAGGVYDRLVKGEKIGDCSNAHLSIAKALDPIGTTGQISVLGRGHYPVFSSPRGSRYNFIHDWSYVVRVNTKNPADLFNTYALFDGKNIPWDNSVYDVNGNLVGHVINGTAAEVMRETFDAFNGMPVLDLTSQVLKRLRPRLGAPALCK